MIINKKEDVQGAMIITAIYVGFGMLMLGTFVMGVVELVGYIIK